MLQRLRLSVDNPDMTEADLWKEQVTRVSNLVHLSISAPPSPALAHALAQYPALRTCTTIDYYKVIKIFHNTVSRIYFNSLYKILITFQSMLIV